MTVKKSYGLILFRNSPFCNRPQGAEVLLIQQRNTYAYIDLVLGKYNADSDGSIIRLLHGMTRDEKVVLLSMNFCYIWYHAFLFMPKRMIYGDGINRSFMAKKRRFEKVFLQDGGKRLRRLINHSRSRDRLWEMPKGRREAHEYDMDAAIREIKEEVGLSPRQYRILWDIEPVIYSHTDDGIKYIYKYYVAVTAADIRLRVMNTHQTMEISDYRWCDRQLAEFLLPRGMYQKIVRLFKTVKHEAARVR